MRRFQPTPRLDTLQHKVNETLENQRFKPAHSARLPLRVAKTLGMDADARAALERLLALAKESNLGVVGRFMTDSGVSAQLAHAGIAEGVEEADFARYPTLAIPFSGISLKQRRAWEKQGHRFQDFTSPQVRRAQVALGLLRMEGAQSLVIGRHEDPETLALAGIHPETRIIQDTTDTARLSFHPAFGTICQTHLSPQRVAWLVQQLRHRYRDARVTFLNTGSPSMMARQDALEHLLSECDHAIIVGEPGESSCEALLETTLRRGKLGTVVSSPRDIEGIRIGHAKIALTAGAFATDDAIHTIAAHLMDAAVRP